MSWRDKTEGQSQGQRRAFNNSRVAVSSTSPPLGALLDRIKSEEVETSARQQPTQITNCELLASFNWMNKSQPTIKFPGEYCMPPVWVAPTKPAKLKEDSGSYFRDQNAARYPIHPIEPAVRAVLAQHPSFDTQTVDVFACGSTIGNLLRCVRKQDKPFRFLVHAIGRTVFLVRRENSPDEKIQDVRGFGHSFPDRYTKWGSGLEDSASHQRMLSYHFAGLKCVVRFEGDGFLEDEVREGLAEATGPLPELAGVDVRRDGNMKLIPQSAIFDLKTRAARKSDEEVMASEMGRFWVTQIPFFILAKHSSGWFGPDKTTVKKTNISAWESNNQDILRQLAAMMAKLIKLARDTPGHKFEVRCQEPGVLEIREQGGDPQGPLPDKLCQLWAGSPSSPIPSESDDDSSSAGGAALSDSDEDEFAGSDEGSDVVDYTACTAECGYCGHC